MYANNLIGGNRIMGDNYVLINYSGKDYIGQINQVESSWNNPRNLTGKRFLKLQYYRISLVEKDTNCIINDIYINSFSEIKPYKETPE